MVEIKDLLGVICISVGVCSLIELAQWVIIYRCANRCRRVVSQQNLSDSAHKLLT